MKLFWQTAAVVAVIVPALQNSEFVTAFYGAAMGGVFALLAISCNE
jgi:hypothetical protein